jgi:hypothetical protein
MEILLSQKAVNVWTGVGLSTVEIVLINAVHYKPTDCTANTLSAVRQPKHMKM